jgi:2-polyprenyl-6-hydroxyphenyl methylase/3-demethylubiquinone-9 3-methyltransferase
MAQSSAAKQEKTGNSTASPEEVARFAAMAEEWWDPTGKFRPLHKFNPTRLTFIRDSLSNHFGLDKDSLTPLKGLKILDIGCGGGLISEPLARLGAQMTSIDAAEKNISIASLHAEQSGLKIGYRSALPEDLLAEGKQFDVVLNLEVVEHVPDMEEFLRVCSALVRPGGAMVGATVNRTLKALALAKFGAEYIMRWLPPGTHDWNKFVKPSEFVGALRRNGIEVTDLKGMAYTPISDSWVLSKNLDMNYLLFGVRGY